MGYQDIPLLSMEVRKFLVPQYPDPKLLKRFNLRLYSILHSYLLQQDKETHSPEVHLTILDLVYTAQFPYNLAKSGPLAGFPKENFILTYI